MGDTHLRSNLKGQDGTQTISGFSSITASNLTASSVNVNTGRYIKLGAHQYILFGNATSEAAVVAAATAIDGNAATGCLYVSTAGALWIFDDNTTATRFQTY